MNHSGTGQQNRDVDSDAPEFEIWLTAILGFTFLSVPILMVLELFGPELSDQVNRFGILLELVAATILIIGLRPETTLRQWQANLESLHYRLKHTRLLTKLVSTVQTSSSGTDRKVLLFAFVYYIAAATVMLYWWAVAAETTVMLLLGVAVAVWLYIPLFVGLIYAVRFVILARQASISRSEVEAEWRDVWRDIIDIAIASNGLPQTVAVAILLIARPILALAVPSDGSEQTDGSLKKLFEYLVIPLAMFAALLQLVATFL